MQNIWCFRLQTLDLDPHSFVLLSQGQRKLEADLHPMFMSRMHKAHSPIEMFVSNLDPAKFGHLIDFDQ